MKGNKKGVESMERWWYQNRVQNLYGVLLNRPEPFESKCVGELELFLKELKDLPTAEEARASEDRKKLRKAS